MAAAGAGNATLSRYVFPRAPFSGRVQDHWVPFTEGCEVAKDCWCYHVQGDMTRLLNPDGWRTCARLSQLETCNRQHHHCFCLHGRDNGTAPCLFSDMRPVKILAVIAAARLAGVTHIIEEGRYGGLSALMYALHGFKVTSVEFLPLYAATTALKLLAPVDNPVELIDGDGTKVLPNLTLGLTQMEAQQTMVIFDGEKRFGAWDTYQKIKEKVAVAVFDDTNLGQDGPKFVKHLRDHEVQWGTTDPLWKCYRRAEEGPLDMLRPLKQLRTAHGKRPSWHGGVNDLEEFHFSIVAGSAWSRGSSGEGCAKVANAPGASLCPPA